jgi:hypothetical protein
MNFLQSNMGCSIFDLSESESSISYSLPKISIVVFMIYLNYDWPNEFFIFLLPRSGFLISFPS